MKISTILTGVILSLASTTAVRADVTSLHGTLSWPEPTNVNPADMKFVIDNTKNTLTELELSQLAARKATRASVRNFAALTAEDDRLAQSSLSQISIAKGFIVPQQLDISERTRINQISDLPRSLFNSTYIFRLISKQAEDLLALESTPENLAPDLKAWADARLSTVRKQFGIANSFDRKDLQLGLLGG